MKSGSASDVAFWHCRSVAFSGSSFCSVLHLVSFHTAESVQALSAMSGNAMAVALLRGAAATGGSFLAISFGVSLCLKTAAVMAERKRVSVDNVRK